MTNVDLTRLSRHERRAYNAVNGTRIAGRNMPFVKKLHGSVEVFNTKRQEEIEADEELLKNK